MTIERLEEIKTEAKHYGKMSESFRLDVIDLIDAEIARQSVADQDVRDAIEYYADRAKRLRHIASTARERCLDGAEKEANIVAQYSELAITALEQMRAEPCDACANKHDILAANKQCEPVTVNYCPNCGRKLVTE